MRDRSALTRLFVRRISRARRRIRAKSAPVDDVASRRQ
jgi:hypothetical protein